MDAENSGYDPRKPQPKIISLDEILNQWRDEAAAKGLKSYNLGSGARPLPGFVNVDFADLPEVDVRADLFGSDWPIPDGSAGLVYICHFMEHVPDWGRFWKEMWRIAADECRVVVYGPHARSNRYLMDPTHCQPLIDEKFQYYLNREWREANQINHYGSDPAVHFVQEFEPFRDWFGTYRHATNEARKWSMLHENNTVGDCAWFLKALKTPESIERIRQAQLKSLETI